jgi:hypothetical protein
VPLLNILVRIYHAAAIWRPETAEGCDIGQVRRIVN